MANGAVAEKLKERPRPSRPGKLGTIIITGSGGFLASAIIERLAGRFDVVGLDYKVPTRAAAEFETIRTDLSDPGSVSAAIDRIRVSRGQQVVSVIHLAAYYDLSGDPSPMYRKVTVEGTRHLLNALRGMQVEQFVFASTILVHAPTTPGKPIDEDWPIDPRTPYPQSKVEAEQALREGRGEIPIAILRVAGVYDDDCHAAFLAQQIANIFEQRMISRLYPGNLDSGQPYLHLDDLVTAIGRAVERRAELPPETTLLIGEPETLSYGVLQARIGELIHGEPWDTREIPAEFAELGQWLQEDVFDLDPFVQPWMIEQASYHLELDISRAKQLLGWAPAHSLATTLPTMIARLKDDPPGWYRRNKLNPASVAAAKVDRSDAGKATERRRKTEAKLREADMRSRWAALANLGLGLWLIASPFAFGLFGAATPGDRLTGWNEIACGIALAVVALLTLDERRRWLDWCVAGLGAWLMSAPLVFWTTSAGAYATDSAAGALAVLFAVVVRPPPGIAPEALAATSDIPLGWTYSPSTYSQRMPIVFLALIGFLVSRYLAAFQLGHIDAVWDPFFGTGTERIVTSYVSEAWPVPDAGVGAATYLLEALTGLIGDRRRWRTMPWLVLAFGLMIVPLGGVSIFFIMIQPVLLGAWCSICLFTAALSVIMIPYSLDELLASAQFLLRSRRAGQPFWRTFWRGGTLPGESTDRTSNDAAPAQFLRNFVLGGVTFPWTLLGCIAIGMLLMATRLLTGAEAALADSDHLVGCFVITITVTALAGMARAVRLLNLPLGAWLIVAPFLLPGGDMAAIGFDIVAGLALIGLSLPRGDLGGDHYGGWDRAIV